MIARSYGPSSIFDSHLVRIRSGAWQPDAHSIRFDRENPTSVQVLDVSIEYLQRRRPLVARPDAHQANDARVRPALYERQIAEVLVERHAHPLLGMSNAEDRAVAWVAIPISDPLDIVPCGGDDFPRAAPPARVKEHPHAADGAIRGATRSCATSRRAYSTQASTSSRSIHG